jgi:K+ transporter
MYGAHLLHIVLLMMMSLFYIKSLKNMKHNLISVINLSSLIVIYALYFVSEVFKVDNTIFVSICVTSIIVFLLYVFNCIYMARSVENEKKIDVDNNKVNEFEKIDAK